MLFKYIFILIFCSLAFGGVADKLIAKLNNMKYIKVSFVQKFYPIGYQNAIVSTGTAYIENIPPFKVKLVYKKPNSFIILFDGKSTMLYNISNNSLYIYNNKSQEMEGFEVFNKNLVNIFKPILTSYQEGYYKILFMPKAGILSDISYIILKTDDKFDIKSAYIFINNKGVLYIKVNSLNSIEPSPNLFKLNLPKHVNIVK